MVVSDLSAYGGPYKQTNKLPGGIIFPRSAPGGALQNSPDGGGTDSHHTIDAGPPPPQQKYQREDHRLSRSAPGRRHTNITPPHRPTAVAPSLSPPINSGSRRRPTTVSPSLPSAPMSIDLQYLSIGTPLHRQRTKHRLPNKTTKRYYLQHRARPPDNTANARESPLARGATSLAHPSPPKQ